MLVLFVQEMHFKNHWFKITDPRFLPCAAKHSLMDKAICTSLSKSEPCVSFEALFFSPHIQPIPKCYSFYFLNISHICRISLWWTSFSSSSHYHLSLGLVQYFNWLLVPPLCPLYQFTTTRVSFQKRKFCHVSFA